MLTSVRNWCSEQGQSNNNNSINVIEETPQGSDDIADGETTTTAWSRIVNKCGNVLGNPHHQLGAIVLLAVFTFFPVFCGIPSSMENSVLRNSLGSTSFQNSNFAMLTLTLVYFADFFIDFVAEKYSQNAYRRYTKHKDVMIDSETLVYIAGTIVVPIVTLPSADHPRLALIYTCANQASFILLGGFVSIMCCRNFRKYFPAWVINFGIVLMCGPCMLTPWAVNMTEDVTVFRNLLYYCKFLGGGVFILYSFRWIYYEFILRMMVPVIKHSYSFVINNSDAAKKKQHTKDSMYFPIMYAMSAITSLLFIAFVDVSSDTSMYKITATVLMWIDLPVLGFQICMLLLKSQFSKYEVVENLYSFETAASKLPAFAQAVGSSSMDGVSRSNIVQRSGRSGRSGHSLSSISLFINRIRGGDRHHSSVDISMQGGPSNRIHCDTDDGHDLPAPDLAMNNEGSVYVDRDGPIDHLPYRLSSPRRPSRDKGAGQGQDHATPRSSSHKWLLDETDGHGEYAGGGVSGKGTTERMLSWEDRRMPSLGDHDGTHTHPSQNMIVSYDPISRDSSPSLYKTIYPQVGGDEKSGNLGGGLEHEHEQAMSEDGSENLGESPDVFGFNLPNHRPRPALHTHSQGPLSSLSQSDAASGDLDSACGGLASRQQPQRGISSNAAAFSSSQQQQYQSQQHYALSGNHQINPQQQAYHNHLLIESKTQSQSQSHSPQPQSTQSSQPLSSQPQSSQSPSSQPQSSQSPQPPSSQPQSSQSPQPLSSQPQSSQSPQPPSSQPQSSQSPQPPSSQPQSSQSPQPPSSQPQSSQSPQDGGGKGSAQVNCVININNHRDREDDIDDDVLTLLSSISLSEARKYHHSKRSQKNQRSGKGSEPRYESPGIPRYRLLVVDDSGLLCLALRTDSHVCEEVPQPHQDHLVHMLLNQHVDEPYDAVLVATKNGQGPALAQAIRALSATVHIFGITEGGHEESVRFQEAGATSVLHKPYTMTFFIEFLRQMDGLYEMKLQQEAEKMLLNEFEGNVSTDGGVNLPRERPSCPLPDEFDV